MAEYDPLGPDPEPEPPILIDLLDDDEEEPEIYVTTVSSSRGFVPISSTTTTSVPGIDLKQLLDQIQRLETRVQNQSTLLLEQTTNYRLMEECIKFMKESMDERLEELEKRIDRMEALAGTQSTSSCRAPPPPSLTSTRLPTATPTTATQQKLHPNTLGRDIPARIPGPARRTTRTIESHQSIPQGLSRTTTNNSSNNQHERIGTVDWGQEKVEPDQEEVECLLPVAVAKSINPLQCNFCPPTPNVIFQDAESLASHYTSGHSIPGVGKQLTSMTDKSENSGMIILPQGGQGQVQSQSRPLIGTKSGKSNKERQRRSGTCLKCGKHVSNIYEHRETHKSPSERRHFICTVCGADFVTKRSLAHHHRTQHTDEPVERPLPIFPCQICGKRFRGRQARKAHVNTHTGERPFPCRHCGKTFSRKTALRAHLFIHIGKPYACDKCGLEFTARCRFATHKLRCHGKMTTARTPEGCQSQSQDHFPRIQRIQTSPKIEIIETTFGNAENTD